MSAMKLGVFLPNGQNGYIISENAPQYEPTFEHCLEISQEVERVGLDFVLSMIKYHGFGGKTGYWDGCLDSVVLATGIAANTSRIDVFATVPILGIPPVIAARQLATFDEIAKGRGGVNLVTGWNRPEYDPMGLWPGDEYYERRYDYAAEYVQILRGLWRDGRTTFNGEFFTINDATCLPSSGRELPIVTAGQSTAGQRYTAHYGDYNFVFGDRELLPQITRPMVQEAERVGRTVGTYALFTVIAAETDEEARAKTQRIVDGQDTEALKNVAGSAALDPESGGTSAHFIAGLTAPPEEGNLTFMSFPVLHGSYESVAEQIATMQRDTGVAGVLMTFVDYVPDIRVFGEKVLPLVREKLAALQSV
ncbi:LLM class flavin-dependent oxidoreductase [Nakamurella leprariae]|uniref:LLM class flavin-dependent oxidoreductase n=1 Tax=Nakamurella leprariae TaxID=2803911 RepID=A0A938YAG1_9ACTN|nr:LLM class flavin-dependent oxidoreductase [Nakamurella leprariae]MBM9468885.1 LLM class flavin-dependent oxidoreductase [Nakamurella leprariae]